MREADTDLTLKHINLSKKKKIALFVFVFFIFVERHRKSKFSNSKKDNPSWKWCVLFAGPASAACKMIASGWSSFSSVPVSRWTKPNRTFSAPRVVTEQVFVSRHVRPPRVTATVSRAEGVGGRRVRLQQQAAEAVFTEKHHHRCCFSSQRRTLTSWLFPLSRCLTVFFFGLFFF